MCDSPVPHPHSAAGIASVVVAGASLASSSVVVGMWAAGVLVAIAPALYTILVATLVLEVLVPVAVILAEAGPMAPGDLVEAVGRAIAADTRRILENRRRRAAALEAARRPLAIDAAGTVHTVTLTADARVPVARRARG